MLRYIYKGTFAPLQSFSTKNPFVRAVIRTVHTGWIYIFYLRNIKTCDFNMDKVESEPEPTFCGKAGRATRSFCRFLYNGEKGTVMGRDRLSWGKSFFFLTRLY